MYWLHNLASFDQSIWLNGSIYHIEFIAYAHIVSQLNASAESRYFRDGCAYERRAHSCLPALKHSISPSISAAVKTIESNAADLKFMHLIAYKCCTYICAHVWAEVLPCRTMRYNMVNRPFKMSTSLFICIEMQLSVSGKRCSQPTRHMQHSNSTFVRRGAALWLLLNVLTSLRTHTHTERSRSSSHFQPIPCTIFASLWMPTAVQVQCECVKHTF